LVFVTDGQVGNEAQLMKLLGQRLKGTRIFPLGIDQAVNAAFLNKLAALGRAGTAELIESEDRLDEVLVRLHRRVDAPVIAELSIDVEGARLIGGTMAPAQLPDVFAGVPASIFGRVDMLGGSASRAAFIVRGRYADGRRFEERIPLVEVQNPAVRTAWARNHLRDLEDRFDANQGDKAGLERKIVEVSLQNRVLCRFTAFVAVDHEVVNRGGYNRQVTQPVEQPAGWAGACRLGRRCCTAAAGRHARARASQIADAGAVVPVGEAVQEHRSRAHGAHGRG
jgi:Ca-activated chloride channel homolog